jgi:hypothetical protein
MHDFTLENISQKIYSNKTKEYIQEVLSSYYNNNNRAAIVTLYSVVIIDILDKLEILDEIYLDTTAKAILDDLKEFQKNNPINPDWERDLIEQVKTRTSIIDNVDYAHIQALRNDRHLCAHPAIDKDAKLYTPNNETVASHIRNMLESLFLKPAILSKKILITILEDIASKKELLIDEESLEKYIKAKYLPNLTPTVEVSLFREIWKFAFRLNDPKSNENRLLIFRVLSLFFKRNSASCFGKIKSESEYFSNILDSEDTLKLLILFLAANEFLYKEFRADVHMLVEQQTIKNPSAKVVAWFINDSFEKHIEEIKILIKNGFNTTLPPYDADITAYQRLINIGLTKGYKKEIADFIIWRYSISKSYDDGDKIFSYLISPNLNIFTTIQFENLLNFANQNGQTFGRNQASGDHKLIQRYIVENIDANFNFEKYKNLF